MELALTIAWVAFVVLVPLIYAVNFKGWVHGGEQQWPKPK